MCGLFGLFAGQQAAVGVLFVEGFPVVLDVVG
jgi:hypothetical protein